MQFLSRIVTRTRNLSNHHRLFANPRVFSTAGGGGAGGGGGGNWTDWGDNSSSSSDTWSTGLTKDQIAGEAVGHQVTPPPSSAAKSSVVSSGGGRIGEGRKVGGAAAAAAAGREWLQKLKEVQSQGKMNEALSRYDKSEMEMYELLKQIEEPGARGSRLKDTEKAEMYKKHKENPEVYTVEKLAQEYRIMRQRVVAILWLKEDEEKLEKERGEPLDDTVERLLDEFPGFFESHDREYHVATLPYKPDFKVMPEGWDGTIRDPDEVHYEISKKEDDMLYEEFLQRFNFNKMRCNNEVNVHKYSRRRPADGWEFIVEKTGARGKRGTGGGWKFASHPDGSTRPLNKTERIYLKRETPRRRRKILPCKQ